MDTRCRDRKPLAPPRVSSPVRPGPRLSSPLAAARSCQQRLSYTILSDLALALIDGTVFEIVQGLLEIQHLTEKNLYNQRLKLHSEHRVLKQEMFHRHKEAQQSCKPHNLPVLKAAQQRELEAVEQRIREEQRLMDEKIVLELDQKVVDQQSTLEKAGVSGFYITTNPQVCEQRVQDLSVLLQVSQKRTFIRRGLKEDNSGFYRGAPHS
ncbi:protein DGCR6-like isoform X1 [Lepidochelys kempii]|uniref:protein DGCR6-like isoform X1 n=1 Tax=Lepidochelys kempii TaxID=8472 RepID=UPI003C6FC75A